MEQQITNLGSILGKDILNIMDGAFVGTVQGAVVEPKERKVTGLVLKQKNLLNNKAKSAIPFAHVKSLSGDLVTVKDSKEIALDGRNIIGLSIITADGVFLGKIADFAFDKDGIVKEYILKDGVMKGLPNDRGAISNLDIVTIGKDAVIAKEGLTQGEFAITDEDIYGDWQKVDEILDSMNEENEAQKKTNDEAYEEHFDEVTGKIGKAFSSAGEKIKEIDTEKVCSKIKAQAGKLGDGFWSFCADLKDHAKSRKYEKEAAKAEAASAQKAAEPADTEIDFDDLAKQFNGQSVSRPLLDDEGNVLVWSGQEITADILRDSEKAGKLDALLDAIKHKETVAEQENEEEEPVVENAAEESTACESEAGIAAPAEEADNVTVEQEITENDEAAKTEAAEEEKIVE